MFPLLTSLLSPPFSTLQILVAYTFLPSLGLLPSFPSFPLISNGKSSGSMETADENIVSFNEISCRSMERSFSQSPFCRCLVVLQFPFCFRWVVLNIKFLSLVCLVHAPWITPVGAERVRAGAHLNSSRAVRLANVMDHYLSISQCKRLFIRWKYRFVQ